MQQQNLVEHSMVQFLFSAKGRVTRKHLWKYASVNIAVNTVLIVAAITLTPDFFGVFVAWQLAAFVPGIIISIKRYHDRNKSGWWYLISFVPIVNIYFVVELFFLAGTPGTNRYGDVPKEHVTTNTGCDLIND
jgi:uncharacterized membrane protein YhaH (DUF805 family)